MELKKNLSKLTINWLLVIEFQKSWGSGGPKIPGFWTAIKKIVCSLYPSKKFRVLVTLSSLFWISCTTHSSKIRAHFGSLFFMIKSQHFHSISANIGSFDQKVDMISPYFILKCWKLPKRRCRKNIGSLQYVWGAKMWSQSRTFFSVLFKLR